MNLSLFLFIIGIVLISYGYVNQLSPKCNDRLITKYVPSHIYDDIVASSTNSFDDYRVLRGGTLMGEEEEEEDPNE